MRLRMPHGHGAAGENPAEILAFADSLTRGGKPLPAFTRVMREGRTVKAAFVCNGRAVVKAELNVTKDAGKWKEKAWEALPVAVQTGPDGTGTVDAQLSEQVTVFYLNIVTDDGLVVSSEHEVLD